MPEVMMKKVLLPDVLVLVISTICFSDTIHVPGDQPTIQAGIDAAANGDVVLVASGTYEENIDFLGKSIMVKSTFGAADTIIDGGNPADPDFGSAVTFANGEGMDSLLEGFTIANGKGTLSEFYSGYTGQYGGGLFLENASPMIRECIFINNAVDIAGGGLFAYESDPTLLNCKFKWNSADKYGAGISLLHANMDIHDCTFIDNFTERAGGGISMTFSYADIFKCKFYGNWAYDSSIADTFGGGLYNDDASGIYLIECVFEGNYAEYGGGFCNMYSIPWMEECLFKGNSANYGGGLCSFDMCEIMDCDFVENEASLDGGGMLLGSGGSAFVSCCHFHKNSSYEYGGGIHNEYGADPHIQNCIFTENSATFGGGVSSIMAEPTFAHCTFTKNQGGVSGGAYYGTEDSHSHMYNSILWGDMPDEIRNFNQSTCEAKCCDVQGGYPGTQNIDADPLFVDPVGNDIHLTYNSPCRDTGYVHGMGIPLNDFEGDPRWADVEADMGADEFHTHLYCTGDFSPNGAIEIKIVGIPGSTPVGLFISSGIMDPPLQHAWGTFHLQLPCLLLVLFPIPVNGIEEIPTRLPSTPAPYDIPMQALVDWELTNLFVLEVR